MTDNTVSLHSPLALSRIFCADSGCTHHYERAGVVVLVLLLHVGLGVAWMSMPEPPAVVVNEMAVTMAFQQAQVVQLPQQPVPPPPQPRPRVEPDVKPQPKPVVEEAAEVAPKALPTPVVAPPPAQVAAPVAEAPPAVAAAPVVDTEPDFRAEYLNNPRPPYPMVARRMGWGGKVILNVEVLAEGACGAVNVSRSSGHKVLDNAAMETVRSWRFVPARHAGRAITKWFQVPINFSVEDSEA